MKPKNQRLTLIFFGLISLFVAVLLILKSFNDNLVFFYSPTELLTKNITKNQTIRIGGLVKEGSVYKQTQMVTTFTLTDLTTDISVEYTGLLPNLFREGQGMVAKGNIINDKLFIASELLAKHDENYMPPEVADALKKSGKWTGGEYKE